MKTIRKTVNSSNMKRGAQSKGIQVINKTHCPHCALLFQNLGQHIHICMMNPERKAQNGAKVCPKCQIASTAKNYSRHLEKCAGEMVVTIDKALQSYRSEYLRIARGGKSVDTSDRSLGYGYRVVPEVFRKNVESDLHDRGMPSEWSISPALRVTRPFVEQDELVTEVKNEHQVIDDDYALAIGTVVNLITDERTMAEVLNHIINLATYKLATR